MASKQQQEPKRIAHPAYFDNPWQMLRPGLTALHVNMWTIIWLTIALPIISVPLVGVLLVCLTLMTETSAQGFPWDSLIFSILSLIVYLVITVLGIFFSIGLVMATLASTKGEKFHFWDAFRKGRKYFWRFTGLMITMLLVVAAGLVLLIVPGAIALKRYLLAPFYLIDQDLGVFDAMTKSANDTAETGGIWPILGTLVALAVPSAIPGVGWVLSLAGYVLYSCVPAARYREIQQALAAQAKTVATAHTDAAVESALKDVSKTVAETPVATKARKSKSAAAAKTKGAAASKKKPGRKTRKSGKR